MTRCFITHFPLSRWSI